MKPVFKKISLLIILMSMVQMLSAQIGYRHNVVPSALPDSLDLAYYSKKYFGRSAATVVGLNFGVWAFDRYVRNQDYAYISLNTMRENLKHGFVWDNDNLGTNICFHPYHGNL